MKKATWEINGDTLALRLEDGEVYVPRSQETYDFIFNDKKTVNGVVPMNEAGSLGDLKNFSKFPLEPVIELSAGPEPQTIVLQIKAEYEQDVVSLEDFFTRVADHVLVNKRWFPLLRGALEDLKAQLTGYGITGQ